MKDLRSFIAMLETEFPEEMIRVRRGPMKPADGECVALLHHLMRQGKRPLAVFERVETLRGEPWEGSCVFQTAGTWTKIGAAYGMTRGTMDFVGVEEETVRRVRQPIPPVRVDPADAPVKERVLRAGEFDFLDTPGYIQNEHDGRPGNITGIIVARDPDSGRYNLSWHHDHILDAERTTTAISGSERHVMQIVRKYRERGADRVPVAQVFGHHVLFGLAAAVRVGLDVDEYALAGGILGEPVRLTPSHTWGEDLLIPADAELVIEGYISTNETAPSSRWGDFTRYYTPAHGSQPVMRVAAVDMRREPIFEHTWVGQFVYSDVAHSSFIRSMLLQRFPTVGAVNYAVPLVVVVQFRPQRPGDVGRLVGMVHAYGEFVKHVIVVDEDVNPFDMAEVMWSIGTRVDAGRQVWISPEMRAQNLDPAGQDQIAALQGVRGVVIDSTRPVGKPFLELAYPEAAVLDRIRPEDWIDEAEIARLAAGNTTRTWARL